MHSRPPSSFKRTAWQCQQVIFNFSHWLDRLPPPHLPLAAPKLFPAAYNLVKHFLCENTQHKIFVLGGKRLHHHNEHQRLAHVVLLRVLSCPVTSSRFHIIGKRAPSQYTCGVFTILGTMTLCRASNTHLYFALFPLLLIFWRLCQEQPFCLSSYFISYGPAVQRMRCVCVCVCVCVCACVRACVAITLKRIERPQVYLNAVLQVHCISITVPQAKVLHFLQPPPPPCFSLRPHAVPLSQLAGGAAAVHSPGRAARHLRGQADRPWWRPPLSHPGESGGVQIESTHRRFDLLISL